MGSPRTLDWYRAGIGAVLLNNFQWVLPRRWTSAELGLKLFFLNSLQWVVPRLWTGMGLGLELLFFTPSNGRPRTLDEHRAGNGTADSGLISGWRTSIWLGPELLS